VLNLPEAGSEETAAIARAIVREDLFDGQAVVGKPGVGPTPKSDRRVLALVGKDL
jgi:hypothetical protein